MTDSDYDRYVFLSNKYKTSPVSDEEEAELQTLEKKLEIWQLKQNQRTEQDKQNEKIVDKIRELFKQAERMEGVAIKNEEHDEVKYWTARKLELQSILGDKDAT